MNVVPYGEPYLDPPECDCIYETIDDVPEDEIDDWFVIYRDRIIEMFKDDILEWAEERAIERSDDYDD